MYPYRTAWHWWLRNRFKHLVDGVERNKDLRGDKNRVLRRRIQQMKRWLVVRLVVLPFLFASIVSAVLGSILDAAGVGSETDDALRMFRAVASSLSGLFVALFFFANRTLGLIETDITLALTVGKRTGQPDD